MLFYICCIIIVCIWNSWEGIEVKKKLYILIPVVLIIVGFAVYVFATVFFAGKPIKLVASVADDKLMTAEEMKGDVDYTVDILKKVHPKYYEGTLPNTEEIVKKAYERIKQPMKAEEFYFILNEIICSVDDAHTYMNKIANNSDEVIDLPVAWLEEGMYVSKDRGGLKLGDKILSIGGKTHDEILNELKNYIPSENDQWVKFRGSSLIIKRSYLKQLGLINKDQVEVKLQRLNEEVVITLPLVASNLDNIEGKRPWVGYTIEKESSIGVFYLDSCIYDKEYKNKLNEFFTEVRDNNIKNVAIDVRDNTGGDSRVINEFIRYLDIYNYTEFGSEVRYSEYSREQREGIKKDGYIVKPKENIKNKKIEDESLIFKGKTYVLTSSKTFSSANWFAVIFKDNKLGTIIGEPTGNQPSSYGDVLVFQTQNSKFAFQVSYKKWTRPKEETVVENCLNPDITVYTTGKDILNNKDAQLEKIRELTKKS